MNSKKKSILIVIIAGIGDLVLASKSIRAIRNGYPDADIHLLTSTEAAPIAHNYEYVDRVWDFPVRDLRKNKLKIFDILTLIQTLRKSNFSMAINLYRISSAMGAIKMALFFSLIKARLKIGHDFGGFGFLLDKKVPADTFRERHFVDAMMDLALLAEGVQDDKNIEVFWDKKSEEKWSHILSRDRNGVIKIGINPGADRPHKRWDPEKYAIVADRLIEHYGAEIILLGGPGEENIAQHIQNAMKCDSINLSGKLSLNDLIYIISQFNLLITNDSGPMHIAAALGAPIVAIFGLEIPAHTRPYTTKDLYRIVQKEAECRPCTSENCERPICLEPITPDDVLKKCHEMLCKD